jgi:manganese/zinc/iron transport system permease protein
MLVIHLLHHEGSPDATEENRQEHLHRHLRWSASHAERVVRMAERRELVRCDVEGELALTDRGRELAREAMTA